MAAVKGGKAVGTAILMVDLPPPAKGLAGVGSDGEELLSDIRRLLNSH